MCIVLSDNSAQCCGIAWVNSVICIQNASKLGAMPTRGFTLTRSYLQTDAYSYNIYDQEYCTCLQKPGKESAHTHFHEFRVIIFFIFFSKPAISMLERFDELNFLLNVSEGVHGPQAIVSLSSITQYLRLCFFSLIKVSLTLFKRRCH